MRLPALCIFGTLLGLPSLFSTTATSGEGGLLGDHGFGPCAATLRPEGPCRPGKDEGMCPYQFSLPPLTIHLPKQLRDLEKIVNDLEKLKDNVDQLRTMCADCKVSQTVRQCGRQSEEDGRPNEGVERHGEEMNRQNERNPERPKDFSQECGKERGKVETTTAGYGGTDSKKRTILEEKEREIWETEKESGKGVVKEAERENPLKEAAEKDGKTERAEGKDKLGPTKVPTSAGYERIVFREKVVEKNRDMDRNKDKDRRVNSKVDQGEAEDNGKNKEKTEESDHHVWRDERKETGKKTQTEEDSGRDEIKMSEGHDEHINKQKDQHGEKEEKEMENGMKVMENNKKTTQIESIGRAEKILKVGEVEDGEIGAKIKTGEKTVQSVQRDMDGELSSSKATERTDFVSIRSTLRSVINLALISDSTGSNKAVTFTSSFPPPPLSSGTTHLITDVNPGMKKVVDGLSNQSTGRREAGISGLPNLFPEEAFRTTSWPKTTATINTLGGPRLQITSPISESPSTTSVRPVSLTTATTTTTPRQGLFTTSFPGGAHRTRWTVSKNSGSNTKTGGNLPPGRGQEPGEKQKPVIIPDAGQKFKNPKNDHKPDRAPLPNRKTKHDQTQKPHSEKLKPGKEPKRVEIPKPDHGPDHLPTNQNLKTSQAPTTDQNLIQKPKSHQKLVPPAPRITSPQRPQTVATGHQPDQRSTTRQYFTPVQTPQTKLMGNPGENPLTGPKSVKDSTPGQELTPGRVYIKHPDPKPKPRQKILEINQRPKPDQKHPELLTDQKTKPKATPRPEDPPRTNQRIEPPRPDQMPDPKAKSVPDQIPLAESNKTSKPRPPQGRRPPTRATVRPGATPLQRLKAALRLKPSAMTKTDLGRLQTGETTTEGLQNSPADLLTAPGSVTESSEVIVSPVDVEFIPSLVQTITLRPKLSRSMSMSDERPQTVGQPPSVPMTSGTNAITRGILPSVIPSTSPGSTEPKQAANTETSLQAKIVDNVEEIAPRTFPDPDGMRIPVPTPSAQTSSTTSPDLRSATLATSGPPAAESSTPSARELRVKIHQVDAFFSSSPNGRPPDGPPEDHPEENQGGNRPESKQSTFKPSKVTTVRDCSDQVLRGGQKSGVYLVTPDLRSRSFPVLCDMELDAGGWTLLQRRQDGSVSFNRTWDEYRSGFGELDGGEFWLGNNMMHLLTRDRDMVLRVELEDFDGVMEYAEYEHFRVGSERMRYRLTVGAYSGTAGDALRFSKSYDHNNRAFTTPDRDNDRYPSGNCGAYYSSGWWFDSCMAANLNGRYYVGSYKGVRDGIYWGTWRNISTEYYPTNQRQSFKTVRMMIRPISFAP
uniref:Fibrinogen C-terminal domain-containing protein n=1 Tax=Gasterosteus aculeatus aculeatus TaxID=481459 RepID=A0AAQ4R4B9_GASAC